MQTEQGWHATDCQPIVSRRSIRVRRIHKRVKTLVILVGATGFEPATPCAQGRCATRLRYAPTMESPWILPSFPRPLRTNNSQNCTTGRCFHAVPSCLPTSALRAIGRELLCTKPDRTLLTTRQVRPIEVGGNSSGVPLV